MLLTAVSLLALAAPLAAVAPQREATDEKGKIEWFAGSWDELQAQAKETEKLVFVHFWVDWCSVCKNLEETTYAEEAVAEALRDVLCFAVDKEDPTHAELVKRYNVGPLPAMLFLEPDGSIRECLIGYRQPEYFLYEIQRIRKNKGTITDYRQRVAAAPEDLELHYRLAKRLEMARQYKEAKRHFAIIAKLDPEGKSLTSRRIALARVIRRSGQMLDPAPIHEFLTGVEERELLFMGWAAIHKIEAENVARARGKERQAVLRRWLEAARKAWAYVADTDRGILGNNIAWGIYEARAEVRREDLLFAVELARVAVNLHPKDANVVDTLACCLHTIGEKDEAIHLMKRCIELQPKNVIWRQRLAEFLR